MNRPLQVAAKPRSFTTAAPSATRGLTLLELMLVIVIMGIVSGVAIGAFASFDPGGSAARGLVANALRQARNDAIAHGATARVLIDPGMRTVRTEGYAVCGTWRFETQALAGPNGANGLANGFEGSFLTDDGYIGRALDLGRGGPGANAKFDVGSDPVFDVRGGFRLSFAVMPRELRDSDLIDHGGVVTAKARRDGSVEFGLTTRREDRMGRASAGETVKLRTTPAVLVPDRWTMIELRYDRRRVVATANGVPVAARGENRELWDIARTLTVGGGRGRWNGCVDDVVLATTRTSETLELPGSVEFTADAPFEVRFDEGGRLDPIEHAGPVEIELLVDGERMQTLLVQRVGTVE